MSTNYPNGFTSDVTIRNVPILNLYPGKVFWVDSVHGAANNPGTFDKPLSSAIRALTKVTANHGDIIICKAGHVETVSSATSTVLNKAGTAIIFLGSGSNKAYFKIGTATSALVSVTAANVALIKPRFVTDIDAVASGLSVAAADFAMVGAEYYDAAAKASTIQVLTTSAATRLYIDGYKYFVSSTGTQKTDGIKTVGDLAGAILKNIDIRGDFTGGYPVNISQAITNLQLENLYLNNLNAGPVAALGLHANTTGFAKNVKCRVASGTTYTSSVAKLSWANDCEGFSTDGYAGEPLGTVLTTGVEGKVESVGAQASTISTGVSTNTSKVDSVGLQVSTVSTGTSTNQSKIDSVGLQASTISTGTSVNASKVDSAGTAISTTQSTIISKTDSEGIALSTTQSTIISTLASIATRISMIASKDGL